MPPSPMTCYITHTGRFLPGEPVGNDDIEKFIGRLWGESKVKKRILAANRIKQRYYAQDRRQQPTHDVYGMATAAIADCLRRAADENIPSPLPAQRNSRGEGRVRGGKFSSAARLKEVEGVGDISYLSAGSTNTPLVGPGLASLIHGRLSEEGILGHPLEINSNSGICSSAAQALVNGCRAIEVGGHAKAICVGAEHPSEILKSSVLRPQHDWLQMMRDLKKSKWFMSVFLRFMLSDGAGACLLQNRPPTSGIGYKVNWTFSQSFASETPLCMKLESKTGLLSQDIAILSQHLGPCVRRFVANAMDHHGDELANYDCVLPHISSYYFLRELKGVMRELLTGDQKKPEVWTNLSTMGNTGAASIFLLLDDYTKTQKPNPGDNILLFVPESGQFNFVLLSLTVAGNGNDSLDE